jgi:hypothetical protein
VAIATKPKIPNPHGRKGNPISLAPLSPDQALAAVSRIKPGDVKRIQAATTRKKGKKQL